MTIPSISRCGFFCISSRSLNVPGLGLVGVADEVLVHRALGEERRLLAHREAGAAAAAQAGGLDLVRRPRRASIASALRSVS